MQNQSTLNQAFFNGTCGGDQTVGGTAASTSMGALAARNYGGGTGGAAGRLSGVSGRAVKSANSNYGARGDQSGTGKQHHNSLPCNPSTDHGRPDCAPAGLPQAPAPAPQVQPASLGAIDLTSGDDSEDMTMIEPPPAKKHKVQESGRGALAGSSRPGGQEVDEYDW